MQTHHQTHPYRVPGQEGPILHLGKNMGANWDYLNACVGAERDCTGGLCSFFGAIRRYRQPSCQRIRCQERGSRGFSSFGSRGLNRNIDVQRESMYDVSEGRNRVFRSMLQWRVSVCPDPKTQAAQISCTMCVCAGNRVSRRGCLTGMHQGEV